MSSADALFSGSFPYLLKIMLIKTSNKCYTSKRYGISGLRKIEHILFKNSTHNFIWGILNSPKMVQLFVVFQPDFCFNQTFKLKSLNGDFFTT